MNKRTLLYLILSILSLSAFSQQEISPLMFGQNIWLDKLYANDKWNNWGQMDDYWDELEDANLKLIRAGGIHYDEHIPTNEIYLEWVDEVRAIGAEPMLQISRKSTSQQAKNLVTYINITQDRNVKYWIIGNEPDYHWNISTENTDPYFVSGADSIKAYTTRISSAIKSIDSTILVVGPETAWMNDNYLSPLLGGNQDITGQDENGNYYVDVITYHQYNDPEIDDVEEKMDRFLGYLETANTNRPSDKQLKWAITEFNITTDNDKEPEDYKTWSFYSGQYFAEVYGLAMKNDALGITPWSTHESDGDRIAYDLGMFDNDESPRSNYYHVHMMANHFSGLFYDGEENQNNVTSFGSVTDDEYVAMILNKGSKNFSFDLRFDGNDINGTSDLEINIDANKSISYQGNINGEETQLLVFDNTTGRLAKQCTYSKENATQKEAPVCTEFDITPVQKTVSEDELIIYPNPTKRNLTVSNAKNWVIKDLQGNVVLEGTEKSINTSSLAPGFYFIETKNARTTFVKE